jgi:hypothetical protein
MANKQQAPKVPPFLAKEITTDEHVKVQTILKSRSEKFEVGEPSIEEKKTKKKKQASSTIIAIPHFLFSIHTFFPSSFLFLFFIFIFYFFLYLLFSL